MDVSIIITTYNLPQWLRKVVWGFSVQTYRRFELVIADDGSTETTGRAIDRLRDQTGLTIRHVWHEDRGFRKCEILNRAIVAAEHEYLIFTDGDCVPRRDFVEQHVRLARRGRFLSGGRVPLTPSLSWQLSKSDILAGCATDGRWLREQGMPWNKKLWLLTRNGRTAALLDAVTTTRATFNGHNASAWKTDVLRVNGFDERAHYGGLDRELGERLVNAGVRGRQIRHRAVCVHLEHPRTYVDSERLQHNREIRRQTIRDQVVSTPSGILKLPTPADLPEWNHRLAA